MNRIQVSGGGSFDLDKSRKYYGCDGSVLYEDPDGRFIACSDNKRGEKDFYYIDRETALKWFVRNYQEENEMDLFITQETYNQN